MDELESGAMAEPGSFRCEVCGFAVALRDGDRLPECPACNGRRFERAPLFADTDEVQIRRARTEQPEWLDALRASIAEDGDFLAFEQGGKVRTIALGDGWTRIGRSLSAEVRIDDPTVSRRHALIHRDGRTVRVLDDRSLNGVFHNGRRVDLEQLEDGDALAVGRFELHFLRTAPDRAMTPA